MRMKILPHVVSMSLALCAAFTAGASPVMSIYDPAEFSLFASRFRAEMSAAGIVDADGSYYEPFFNADMREVRGTFLFEGLSPSFRCTAEQKADCPGSFKEYSVPGADLHIEKHSFVLKQGLETVECRALASADWGGDGTKDSIVLCRIKRGRALGFLDSDRRGVHASEKPSVKYESQRDYYLIVPKGSKTANVAGICDYSAFGRQALFKTFAEAERFGLFNESLTVEMVRGQGTVIEGPASAVKERRSFGSKSLSN